MRTRARVFFLRFICLGFFAALMPNAASAASAETDSAMSYLRRLANPEFYQGRKSGEPGGTASQLWVAQQFKRWGLRPLVGDSLLVPFAMLASVEKKAKLVLLDTERYGDVEFLLGDDYTLTVNSGSGTVTAPVVLVGHGISKPQKGWDDYGEMDVTGKIVLIIRGEPDNRENWDKEYSRTYLLNEAKRRGAAGVLFYMGEDAIGGAAIMADAYTADIPSAVIGRHVLAQLFYQTGLTHDIYDRVLKLGPHPMELQKTVRLEAKVKLIKDAQGYDVAGVVPGTDPNLAREAVIVGGHGDHVGRNALGHVYPGADDNGSGACVVMELAREFARKPQPRTMVFLIFGGEEQGLLGSEAIVPMLPDSYDYITMVNLDMGGRGEGITGIGGGNQVPDVWFPFYSELSDSLQATIEARRAWGGYSSDHAPFREAGIPAFTTWSKGSHDHYHTTEDTYRSIDSRAIGGCISADGLWLETLASYPHPLRNDYQKELTLWHRGDGVTWRKANGDVNADLGDAVSSMKQGYVATVVEFPLPDNTSGFDRLLDTLDRYRDAIAANDLLKPGAKLSDLRGNAGELKGTVYLAVDGDGFSSADSSRTDFLNALGMNWVRLENPSSWVSGGMIRYDKRGAVDAWKRLGTIVEAPLSSAGDWPVLNEALGGLLFTGSWDDFAALDEDTGQALSDNGAHFLLNVDPSKLPAALAAVDRIHKLDAHLQPSNADYHQTLAWVRNATESGVEEDTLLQWIGGNMGKW